MVRGPQQRLALELRLTDPGTRSKPRISSGNDALSLKHGGSTLIARSGEVIDTLGLPGFAAIEADAPVGRLTYTVRDTEFEIVTLHVEREGRGAGRALMDAARSKTVGGGS